MMRMRTSNKQSSPGPGPTTVLVCILLQGLGSGTLYLNQTDRDRHQARYPGMLRFVLRRIDCRGWKNAFKRQISVESNETTEFENIILINILR